MAAAARICCCCPFVQRMDWWQTGLAGAWPSMICYVASVLGFYRLARHMLSMRWAMVAVLFFALNPALIYLSVTAMTEPLFLALVIWGTLQLLEFSFALRAGEAKRAVWRLCLADAAAGGCGLHALRTDGYLPRRHGASRWLCCCRVGRHPL